MGEWSDWYSREDPTKWVLAEVLKRRATEHPDREYLKYADNAWVSYGEVNARANRVANALLARGLQKGESVSVLLPNCEDFLPVWYGILKAGGVMSSINTAYKGDFLSWTINLVESRTLFIADSHLDRLDLVKAELPHLKHVIVLPTGAPEGPSPDTKVFTTEPFEALQSASDGEPDGVEYSWTDDARIMFTSGTTGRSKGVIKQNAADYFSARGLLEVVSGTSGRSIEELAEDTFFSCLPLFHSNAQVLSGYPALVAGGRVAYTERFSSSRFWQQIIDAEATIFNSIGAVSYFIWNIPESPLDRQHKVHTCFAAPAPRDIYNEFQDRFGVKFIEGYGLTETGMATYMDPTRPAVPGSMGKANPGYEVTVVEPGTDLPVPPNTPGEIVVDMKIPNIVMRAYYGMPEKTAEDFRNLKLHTGDLGRMDEDGYFYFMDRVKDYIRRRGENVSSMEVERQVSDHPAIKEAAVIGVKAGEGASSEDEIMVVCIPEGQAPDPAEFTQWMAERMPYFMVPRYIRFVDELPKTPTERVQKVKLREQGITPDTFDREAAGITVKR
ncbi:AMP-binding protein [Mycolicibacterium sp.]|uniref:AMP-binding protein n=1 Tax=Mycolicibacterium sp. TaxID=2320850 RepID=UPI0037C98404